MPPLFANAMRREGPGVSSKTGLEKSMGKENRQETKRKTHQSPKKLPIKIPSHQTLSFSGSWL
jgi:hypothetical protein